MIKKLMLLFCMLIMQMHTIFSQEPIAKEAYVCPPCNSHCDGLEFDAPGACNHCGMDLILASEAAKIPRDEDRLSIAFYLQSGVEVLDFAGPMEVFAYAGFRVFTVSKTKEIIQSQGILNIMPDYSIEDAPKADILAFFGGNANNTLFDSEVQDWIKKQQDVQYHFSVCTGAFALAEAGVLDQKTATTFHNALESLEKNYPKVNVVKNARYVDNGKVITTAGISAGIDGALHLVAKLNGFNAARSAAYYMEYDKWIPGEGLLLCDDDPYKNYINQSHFTDFTGKYEFYDDATLEIRLNPREQSLEVVLADQVIPILFEGKDEFRTLQNDTIQFIRNKAGKVTAYTTSNNSALVLNRLEK